MAPTLAACLEDFGRINGQDLHPAGRRCLLRCVIEMVTASKLTGQVHVSSFVNSVQVTFAAHLLHAAFPDGPKCVYFMCLGICVALPMLYGRDWHVTRSEK